MLIFQVNVLLLYEIVFLDELLIFLEELIVLLAFFGQKILELPYGLLKLLDLLAGLLIVGVMGLKGDFFGRELLWAKLYGIIDEYLALGLTMLKLSLCAHNDLKESYY